MNKFVETVEAIVAIWTVVMLACFIVAAIGFCAVGPIVMIMITKSFWWLCGYFLTIPLLYVFFEA